MGVGAETVMYLFLEVSNSSFIFILEVKMIMLLKRGVSVDDLLSLVHLVKDLNMGRLGAGGRERSRSNKRFS